MPSENDSVPDDVEALRELPGRMMAAWADSDAEAYAALFTEDGVMVIPGVYLKSRGEILEFMTAAFSGAFKGTRVTGTPLSAKLLSAESGVVITEGGVLLGDETGVAPERVIRATWVLVKQDGHWLISTYTNSPATAR